MCCCRRWKVSFVVLFGAFESNPSVDSPTTVSYVQGLILPIVRNCASTSYTVRRCKVVFVELSQRHTKAREPNKFLKLNLFGKIMDGRKYALYLFFIHHDGFVCATGSSATANGIYIQPLSFPVRLRTDPDSVRIVWVTPPGVRFSVVLKELMHELIQGMTDGWVIFDADGVERVIFLDFIGFLGFTPGFESFPDVGSHSANTFCHQRRISKRTDEIIGNQYSLNVTWNQSSHLRNAARHISIRNMKVPVACRFTSQSSMGRCIGSARSEVDSPWMMVLKSVLGTRTRTEVPLYSPRWPWRVLVSGDHGNVKYTRLDNQTSRSTDVERSSRL